MSGATLKEGFLTKSPPEGRRFASWRKRFFRLRESGHLDYYLNEKKDVNDKIDGINLGNCTGVEVLQQYEGKDFCIRLTTTDRVYVLKCATEDELRQWYDIIKRTRDAACGMTTVTLDAAATSNPVPTPSFSPSLPAPRGGGASESRPLPGVPVSTSQNLAEGRHLPAVPPDGHSDDRNGRLPAALNMTNSFDSGMVPKKKRQDTAKPRASLPTDSLNTDPFAAHDMGRPSLVDPEPFPGAHPTRVDGYTQVNFGNKQNSASKLNTQSLPPQNRINYAHVEIGGRAADPPPVHGAPNAGMDKPGAGRVSYTRVDLAATRQQASKPAKPSATQEAPPRSSYMQIDLTKTEHYRRSTVDHPASPTGPALPPLPKADKGGGGGGGQFTSSSYNAPPPPGLGPPDEYEEMSQPMPPSNTAPAGSEFLDEYEQMDNPEPPPPVPRPKVAPRRSLRSPGDSKPQIPMPAQPNQPALPPRPYQ